MTLARDSRGTVIVAGAGVLFTLVAPSVLELFTIINLTTAIALGVLALSLALVWGYGGILCFGQTAFFGLGAYAYTIAAINFGGSSWAILVAVLVAVAFAVVLGYVMFYGRVSDVYLAVITLTVSLILYSLIRRTSGPDYRIGQVPARGLQRHHFAAVERPVGHLVHSVPRAPVLRCDGRVDRRLRPHELADPHPFRPGLRLHPGERAPRRAPGLRRAALQARDLRGRCGYRGARRGAVLQWRRAGDAGCLQPLQRGAHHHLGDRRGEGDAHRPRPRRVRAVLSHLRSRHPVDHQQQPRAGHHPRGVRARSAERRGSDRCRLVHRPAEPSFAPRPRAADADAPVTGCGGREREAE